MEVRPCAPVEEALTENRSRRRRSIDGGSTWPRTLSSPVERVHCMADRSALKDVQALHETELIALYPEWVSCKRAEARRRRRKYIVTYDVVSRSNRPGKMTLQIEKVVVKFYGSDRGQTGYETLVKLWEAGFRPPSAYRVPHVYGYLPQRGALIQSQVQGTHWADYLGSDFRALRASSTAAADWLLALQRTEVEGAVADPVRDANNVRRFIAELGSLYPASVSRLERLGKRLIGELEDERIPLVSSHGDFHPKNVFLSEEATTVIDFDTFACREEARDAGYAIGQLLVMSWFRLTDFGPGAEAASAFWRRFSEGNGCPWDRVALHIALTLLQSLHYELYTLKNGRTELLDLWPDLMKHWLESDGPEALEHLVRGR
jgi:Phosphotransferase enzyme family